MSGISILEGNLNGTATTLIRVGAASGDLPRHLIMGEKACGYTVRGATVEPWNWIGINERDGFRHIQSERIDILPFSELATTLRPKALPLLRDMAYAMQQLPAGFLHITNGCIETWRIFFLASGGFLFLPEQLSQIILYSAEEEDRRFHHLDYLKPETENPFGLCHQFAQFLYLAATGIAPYGMQEVREDRWQHIPLSLGIGGLPAQTATWIDGVLSMSPKTQRETVSAAYSAEANLRWFLSQTETLAWTVSDRMEPLSTASERNPALAKFLAGQAKRARRRVFWRKKGSLVITLAVGAAILIGTVGNVAYKNLQPPYTAGMDAREVIEEFFAARDTLDVQRMGASLARGTKNPFETEVTGLFVNSRVRKAYEGIDPVLNAGKWIAEGMPPIPESTQIYGIADLKVEQAGEDLFKATFRSFYPGESFEQDGKRYATVEEWLSEAEFTVTLRRGYWVITSITSTLVSLQETHTVATYPATERMAPSQLTSQ